MQALGLVRLSKNLNFVAISFTKLSECKKNGIGPYFQSKLGWIHYAGISLKKLNNLEILQANGFNFSLQNVLNYYCNLLIFSIAINISVNDNFEASG